MRGDLRKAVQQLKQELGKGLFLGGVTLPLALAELGLIDEYEFVVQPRLAGHGPALFAGPSKGIHLKLVSRRDFGSGAVAMRYEPRRVAAAPFDTVARHHMIGLAIRPLVEHADAIPRIAEWFYDEWREIYGKETLASVQQRIATWLTPDRVPTALVAVSADRVVGTVALKERELQFTYSPWLAGLFVIPQMRRKGIGALLISAAERKAASLGVERLYLYTPGSRVFYERHGWLVLQHCQLPSGRVAVMSKRFSHPEKCHSRESLGVSTVGVCARACSVPPNPTSERTRRIRNQSRFRGAPLKLERQASQSPSCAAQCPAYLARGLFHGFGGRLEQIHWITGRIL